MKPSICFVSLQNYPVLAGKSGEIHIGGAEAQQSYIARELVHRGYAVTFVTLDHGQPDGLEIEGIRVFKAYSRTSGRRYIRFFHPRLKAMWKAMAHANADVYYQRMADVTTGLVAAFTRMKRRAFVFGVAHDYDCVQKPPAHVSKFERSLYRLGLHGANAVIAQTHEQQQMLAENFKVRATVIPNCGIPGNNMSTRTDSTFQRILWVGRFGRTKRLEMLFDVAGRCPDLTFEVVGGSNQSGSYGEHLKQLGSRLSNVVLRGPLPRADLSAVYNSCDALVCTSAGEGFPNTFVEAWSHGLPVVSTVDPGRLLSSRSLGLVAENPEDLVRALRELQLNPGKRQRIASDSHLYFSKHLTIDVVVDQFEAAIREATVAGSRNVAAP